MPITAALLEERINQYINAVDRASAANDSHQVTQLQRDIQQLVDLMERVNSGHTVPESVIPPPLAIAPQIDVLKNPIHELSSRLENYHKALYFAEEELTDKRMQKIQRLQQGLQIINDLQKNVEAGFPVRIDEVPPPVPIPSDDEFDNNAVETITQRISSYKAALTTSEQAHTSSEKKHVPKLLSALRTLEFLMTRAKANRPVWKRDIPPEYEYFNTIPEKTETKMNKTKFILLLRSQLLKASKMKFTSPDLQEKVSQLHQKLSEMEKQVSAQNSNWQQNETLFSILTKQAEDLEKLASENQRDSQLRMIEKKVLIESRIKDYTASALKYKRENQINQALQIFKSIKSLQAMLECLEKGEDVDMSLVPPPLTSEEPPPPYPPEKKLQCEPSPVAAAHLSPVLIKPAIETHEDRLAKKLSQYLEKGPEDFLLPDQRAPSHVNVNLCPAQATGLLPKVSNLAAQAGASGSVNGLITSTGMEPMFDKPDFEEKKKLLSEREYDEASGQHEEKAVAPQHLSATRTTSDIYVRKTLDSVGFLACQNVPDKQISQSVSTELFGSVQILQPCGETSPENQIFPKQFGNEGALEANVSDVNAFGLPELNFHEPTNKWAGPSSLDLSVRPSEKFPDNKFYSLPVVLNHSDHGGQSINSAVHEPMSLTLSAPGAEVMCSTGLHIKELSTPPSKGTSAQASIHFPANSNNLTESSEFQDLMNSMMMPTVMPTLVNNATVNAPDVQIRSVSATGLTLVSSPSCGPSTTGPDANSIDIHRLDNRNKFTSNHPDISVQGRMSLNNQNKTVNSTVLNSSVIGISDGSRGMLPQSVLPQVPQPVFNNTHSVYEFDNLSNGIEFTCLENLKYDFLIKEAKDVSESKEEAASLRGKFEAIKHVLSQGNLEIWEEYESCVESELASLIKQIETLRSHQRWTEMKILSEKKQIAERELAILRERLPELKF